MAGNPRRRAMIDALERRAEEHDGDIIAYASQWLGSGRTILDLAGDISDELGSGDGYVSRYMVSTYLKSLPGGAEAIAAATLEAGEAHADTALSIADEEVDDKAQVARNKLRSDVRFRMAGALNPTFRDQKGPTVNINLNDLHLDALRTRRLPDVVIDAGEEPAQLEAGDPAA